MISVTSELWKYSDIHLHAASMINAVIDKKDDKASDHSKQNACGRGSLGASSDYHSSISALKISLHNTYWLLSFCCALLYLLSVYLILYLMCSYCGYQHFLT